MTIPTSPGGGQTWYKCSRSSTLNGSLMMLSETTGHSAKVEIRLRVQGMVLKVAQVGEESLILRDPCELPPCYGLIEIDADGPFPVIANDSGWLAETVLLRSKSCCRRASARTNSSCEA